MTILLLAGALLASRMSVNILPMHEGERWTYRGKVKWSERVGTSIRDRSRTIVWESRIIRVFRGNDREVAVFRGFPDDLAWYTPETKPSFTVVVQTQSGIFKATAENEDEAISQARSALSGGELGEKLMGFPLVDGVCVADDDGPPRNDSFYCWLLSRESGKGPEETWSLSYRSNPDDGTFRFQLSLGIIGYEYHHHGTLASAEVHLVRHAGK